MTTEIKYRCFEIPHRALRNLMAHVQQLCATADFADPIEVLRLKATAAELFVLLEHHMHIENEYLLKPIDAFLPGFYDREVEEHDHVHHIQDELKAAFEKLQPTADPAAQYELYLHMARFHGFYLNHMNEEETETDRLANTYFTTEELHGLTLRIIGEMKPEEFLQFAKWYLPYMPAAQRNGMLDMMGQMMPPPAYEALLNLLPEDMRPVALGA